MKHISDFISRCTKWRVKINEQKTDEIYFSNKNPLILIVLLLIKPRRLTPLFHSLTMLNIGSPLTGDKLGKNISLIFKGKSPAYLNLYHFYLKVTAYLLKIYLFSIMHAIDLDLLMLVQSRALHVKPISTSYIERTTKISVLSETAIFISETPPSVRILVHRSLKKRISQLSKNF